MKTAIFLGPSLPRARAEALFSADYYPPARQGDVLRMVREETYDAIVLIDGEDFSAGPLVWHKEILYALSRGIRVLGSSGVGAVRGAELYPFGMEGVGEIFRMYREGLLERDDAVAAPFQRTSEGYLRLGEPLVNLRATLEASAGLREISQEEAEGLLSLAEGFYYRDRSIPGLLERGEEKGLFSSSRKERLGEILLRNYVDLLAEDALELLEYLKKTPEKKVPEIPSFRWRDSHTFRRIFCEETPCSVKEETVTSGEIAAVCALGTAEGFQMAVRGLNRRLGLELARHLGVEAAPEEIEQETVRFRRRKGIADPEAWEEWLRNNHMEKEDFRRLMKEEALLGRLRHWLFMVERFGTPVQSLLDEMRLEGVYEKYAHAAEEQQTTLRALGVDLRHEVSLQKASEDMVTSFLRFSAPATMDRNFPAWCEDMGMESGRALREVLKREVLRKRLERIVPEDSHKKGEEGA